jgi:hypothetical protein
MFEMTMHAAAREAAAFCVLRVEHFTGRLYRRLDVALDLFVARARAIGSLKMSGRRVTRSGYRPCGVLFD